MVGNPESDRALIFIRALESLRETRALSVECNRTLFLRADGSLITRCVNQGLGFGQLECIQSLRPAYDHLAKVQTILLELKLVDSPTAPYDFACYLPTNQVEENLHSFAIALENLKEGGIFLVALSNDFGAKRFEKKLKELAGNIESISKYHCRAFWARKDTGLNQALLTEWLTLGKPSVIPGTNFLAAPGMFSYRKMDSGSKLLAEFLPKDLLGTGADLGSGCGYLTAAILEQSPEVSLVHLIEAEKIALNASTANLARFESSKLKFHWRDVTKSLADVIAPGSLDWVIMNPPFHDAGSKDLELGLKFIAAAHALVKPGARVILVANTGLPYERELESKFSSYAKLCNKGGFKVLEAVR